MRLVLANKFLYPRGGAERAVLTLGAELARRGHEVHYFGMQNAANAVGGDDVELVPWRDYRQHGAARWRDAAAMLYSPSARRSFGRLLDRVRPDVVHAHNIYHQLTPSILDAARQRGVPVVMTLHDYKLVCPRYDMLRHGKPCDACIDEGPAACVRYRCAGGSWGASLLLACESALHRARGSYEAVRLFLVPSLFLASVLLRAGFARERLRHVPNFATAVASEPGVAEPGRFLYAGRLSPEKGVETLARAASRLRRGELVLCGTGPLEPALRALALAAPPGRIRLLGHLPATDLWRETARSSFAVAPSEWYENAPFAVLEAMALGRAVVASHIGGLPELVGDGETGDLVPPGDEAAWTEVLERDIENPDRMRRMGDRARWRARDDFGLDRHVDRVLDAYAEAQS